MSFSFELLPDEPILIGTIHDSFSLRDDIDSFLSELDSILDSVDQPVYYINDIRKLKVNVFQDFVLAANKGARDRKGSHPNVDITIVVSTDSLVRLGARGLQSDVFGNLPILVSDTLEEALAQARSLIEQETEHE